MNTVNQHSKTSLKPRSMWTISETKKLYKLVNKYGKDWVKISTYLSPRTNIHCKIRWYNYPPNTDKTPMTGLEKFKLRKVVEIHGTKWTFLREKYFPERSPKQLINTWRSFMRKNGNK